MKVQITRDENGRLRWLQQATAKNDERPSLQCMHVINKAILSTDGWRMHCTRVPSGLIDQEVVRIEGRVLKKDCEIEVAPRDDQYPDVSGVIPTSEPVHEVYMDAKRLREALSGMEGGVTLRFYGEFRPVEVLGRSADETEAYALIMPLRKGFPRPSRWRPETAQGFAAKP